MDDPSIGRHMSPPLTSCPVRGLCNDLTGKRRASSFITTALSAVAISHNEKLWVFLKI